VVPTGTATFLLTDVEGSTRLWEARHAEMGRAVARHDEILDDAVAATGGVRPVEQGEGDSALAALSTAADAVRAALDAQRQLRAELEWLPVRMAVHTGDAELRGEGNHVGQAIIRGARLRSCGQRTPPLAPRRRRSPVRPGTRTPTRGRRGTTTRTDAR